LAIADNLGMLSAPPSYVEALGPGVHAVDTGFVRDRFDAAYLLVQDGRAAFIDTGTTYAVPRLLGALDALGLSREAVDWVIPTHVHLDHAGGAGALMQALPQARMLVHPRGLRHMVDPGALWQGALAVYGQAEMDRSYGRVVPVAAERATATHEGMTVQLGGRTLAFADTPGHARHHHCVWDAATRGWFAGDTFGLSYPEFDTPRGAWIVPTTTPVQFEPQVWQATVRRLLAADPACMYLTHYGRVDDVQRLGAQLVSLIDELAALGRVHQHDVDRHDALKRGQFEIFTRSLAAHGCTMGREAIAQLLAMDLELNAQGIAIWLDRH
jgi:glyoxylase-like metal-dependent hydrolase (beta-lactamase superfamily II)